MSHRGLFSDDLLLRSLSCREIDDICLLQPEPAPRRNLYDRGLLNVEAMDSEEFYHLFRFRKMDLADLASALLIPEEVVSAQRVRVPGNEALCMTLRRLAYPNRLCELELLFNRHSSVLSSVVSSVLAHIEHYFDHLLADMTTHKWLNLLAVEKFSEAVHAKGAPLDNCWAFIDGTARQICRPTVDQQEHYSGHKRHHVQKYQAVMCPNGIVCQLDGPFKGRRHDAGILKETKLYENLEKITMGRKFVIYGDPAYPLLPLLYKPFGGTTLQPYEAFFNKGMSRVRQAVEWGFSKVATEFAFVDFHKNQKMSYQRVGRMYRVATFLANCHTCLYGSQVSDFFDVCPPSLDEYLVPHSI
ncbi:uncharacterized protein LOC142590720 [Dermacentor variabilis]|uniref:uncharacterized protein LOC142590720 n=1 Tax=Dermacentor variabilis TaxID=34621 RepID=UPI003F5B4EE7